MFVTVHPSKLACPRGQSCIRKQFYCLTNLTERPLFNACSVSVYPQGNCQSTANSVMVFSKQCKNKPNEASRFKFQSDICSHSYFTLAELHSTVDRDHMIHYGEEL